MAAISSASFHASSSTASSPSSAMRSFSSLIDISIAEAELFRIQRKMTGPGQPAGQVAGVQQREPDAGIGGRLDQRLAHGIGIGVPATAMIMMQIVELPHDGVSGLHHLDKDGSGEREVGIGIEASCEGVHLPTPGPEAAAFGVRPAPEGAMEGVAVAISKTRKRHAIENLLTGSRFEADPNARETPLVHIEAHAC